ncbi:AMP-binding protein [Alphaproteobacteria bacterium]|nr:AMP-binding protein [Alphaproteobacteria bacterium]
MSLFNNLAAHKNNTALILANETSISFNELACLADNLGSNFTEKALVLIISKFSHEPVIGYVSAIKSKSVVMFADEKLSYDEILQQIESYQPDFVFGPASFFDDNTKLEYSIVSTLDNYKLARTKNTTLRAIFSDLALLLPTSGTLGTSKFVRLSYNNLLKNAQSIIEYLEIKALDRAITTMPLSYSYMLSIVNSHLCAGASIVICEHSIVTKHFWQIARRNGITSLNGVPIFFDFLIKMGLEKIELPSLRVITQAGGRLDTNKAKKMIKFAQNKKIEYVTMYGQTEASPRIAYLEWKHANEKLGSIGKPLPGIDLWLKSHNGEKITKPHCQGEIMVAGENVCLGYANSSSDLQRGDDNGGVLSTGDIAYQDKEGFFYIVGRLKRIAKLNGIRISLDDLETKAQDVGHKIFCLEDGDKIRVFYDKLENRISIETLLQKLTKQNKLGFSLTKIDKIPLLENGKVNYQELSQIKR